MLFFYIILFSLCECVKFRNSKTDYKINKEDYVLRRKTSLNKLNYKKPINRVVKVENSESKSNGLSQQIHSLKAMLDTVRRWDAHGYDDMSWFVEFLNKSCEPYAYLYSIGSSVQNRELWVIALSDNPSIHELTEPEIKIIGNIHGNEGIGREVILHMIDHICSNIDNDENLKNLIHSTRIHFLPSMNPDGFEMYRTHLNNSKYAGRLNANGIDLNRNFPDQFFPSFHDPEPETQAVIKWSEEIPFMLSASLHDGAFVVTYPYDDSPSGQTKYSATPDDDIFRFLARLYSETHPEMHLSNMGNCSRYSQHKKFIGGITNGAEWSSLTNTMQDYNYVRTNCFEITVEMSCNTYLNSSNIPILFNNNYPSLIGFIRQSLRGIKGIVKDNEGNMLEGVHISISDRKHDVLSTKYGDFWRLILPGTYEVSARLKGYESSTRVITVENTDATWVNFTLIKSVTDPSVATLGHVGSLQKYLNLMAFESDGRDSAESDIKVESNSHDIDDNQDEAFYENRDSDFEQTKITQGVPINISSQFNTDAQYILPTKVKPAISSDTKKPSKPYKINDILECSIPGRLQHLVGKLRWTGVIPDLVNHTTSHYNPVVLGIELVDADNLATDGTFLGKRYFSTKPKHAYFVPNNLCDKYRSND